MSFDKYHFLAQRSLLYRGHLGVGNLLE